MSRRRWELWRGKGGVKNACELARALRRWEWINGLVD